MKQDELEKIKTEFIVNQNTYEEAELPNQIRRLLQFVRVGREGKVFIHARDLNPDLRLKLTLVARFLASKLQPEIKGEVAIEELSEHTNIDKDQVRARMSNIVKQKFALRQGRGLFAVLPFQIQKFLDELESGGGK